MPRDSGGLSRTSMVLSNLEPRHAMRKEPIPKQPHETLSSAPWGTLYHYTFDG